MRRPLLIGAGAGAGLGQSILSRFERGDFTVVGLGRTPLTDPIGEFHTFDLSDERAVQTQIAQIIDTTRSRDFHSLHPSKMMKPEDIAETYWQLAHQPKSTWTHELDLRPASEGF